MTIESHQDKIKTELPFYVNASSIYEQIFSLHEMLTKITEIFLLATGAVWVAVASNELSLPLWMRVALCVLILVAGVQMSIVNYGALRSIRARFEMVDKIGEVSFPTILALGRDGFSDGAPDWATWGKPARVECDRRRKTGRALDAQIARLFTKLNSHL